MRGSHAAYSRADRSIRSRSGACRAAVSWTSPKWSSFSSSDRIDRRAPSGVSSNTSAVVARLQQPDGAARGAFGGRSAQRDHREMAQRARTRVAEVLGLLVRAAELCADVAAEPARSLQRLRLQDDRRRAPGAGELDLVDDGDLRGGRERVHERQRERLPPWRQRAADGDEARDARAQHPLVDREVDRDGGALGTQAQELRGEGDIRLRARDLVAEQAQQARDRAGVDGRRHDQAVTLHEPVPEPVGIVGCRARPAREDQVAQADELDVRAGRDGAAERLLQQDLGAAVGGTRREPEQPHQPPPISRRHAFQTRLRCLRAGDPAHDGVVVGLGRGDIRDLAPSVEHDDPVGDGEAQRAGCA